MKIGIIGCAGRMGRALIREVLKNDATELAGGCEHTDSEFIATDLGSLVGEGNLGIVVSNSIDELAITADALINFTQPEATIEAAHIVAQQKKIHVIGTTGLNDQQQQQLANLASTSPIIHAHNMSVGVNLLLKLVEEVASKLPPDVFDIEIVEMHHRHKIDSPSGTALSLGEAAASGRNINLNDVACKARDGQVGARPNGEIGFATLRGGAVVGDHTVIYASDYERIELTHKAQDRAVFAHGAVRAALWAKEKPAGLYCMKDVLDSSY